MFFCCPWHFGSYLPPASDIKFLWGSSGECPLQSIEELVGYFIYLFSHPLCKDYPFFCIWVKPPIGCVCLSMTFCRWADGCFTGLSFQVPCIQVVLGRRCCQWGSCFKLCIGGWPSYWNLQERFHLVSFAD